MTAASTISPARTGIDSFSTVGAPSAPTNSMRSVSSAATVTDFSVERKSPSDIVETCDFDSCDHAPIECGCERANAFTEAGARRSELPSRSTGLTAEPFTRSYASRAARASSEAGVVRVVRDVEAAPPEAP